jgi:hypothetical protein
MNLISRVKEFLRELRGSRLEFFISVYCLIWLALFLVGTVAKLKVVAGIGAILGLPVLLGVPVLLLVLIVYLCVWKVRRMITRRRKDSET